VTTTAVAETATSRPSAARDRLLATAARLFYAQGIAAVGVDRLVGEAGVTRATFYRHFPGKDDLVVAWLRAGDEAVRTAVQRSAALDDDPVMLVRRLVAAIGAELCGPGFRGCAFINAAVEFPDPASPVHRVVREHRAWLARTLTDALGRGGHPDPAAGAQRVVVLRDGAMVAGYLGDPVAARATFAAGVEDVLALTRP
jgi:AcrR family transcriptional regulator